MSTLWSSNSWCGEAAMLEFYHGTYSHWFCTVVFLIGFCPWQMFRYKWISDRTCCQATKLCQLNGSLGWKLCGPLEMGIDRFSSFPAATTPDLLSHINVLVSQLYKLSNYQIISGSLIFWLKTLWPSRMTMVMFSFPSSYGFPSIHHTQPLLTY